MRQNEGFKNVSLGNVLSAKAPDEPTPFIRDEDQKVYDKYKDEAFEVQVSVTVPSSLSCEHKSNSKQYANFATAV